MERGLIRRLGLARGAISLTIVLGLCTTVLTVARLALLSTIVARVFVGHAVLTGVTGLLALLVALSAAHALLLWLREISGQRAAIRGKAHLRARLFTHLFRLGPAYTRGERSGELLAVATEGVERLDPYIDRYLPQVALSVLTPLIVVVAVCTQDWVSGVILLGTAPIIPLLLVLVGSYAEVHIQRQWTALSRMSAHFLDALQGLPTLKALGRGGAERLAITRISRAYRERTLKTLRYAFLSGLVLEFITAGAIALVAVSLGARLLSGGISFERAFFVLLLTPEFYRPLRELGVHRHAAMEGGAAATRLVEILATPVTAPVAALAGPLPGRALTITFNSVSYGYPGSSTRALCDLHLALPSGAVTALVGRSGSGKSTLVQLLMRFMEPSAGAISANGLGIEALAPEEWRAHLALVPQRPHLFAGSVLDNIRLGRPDASRAEVEWAAELSGAAEFISRLPAGYDTALGERGTRLSGGEAQRLAIARAFLRDAPVLILDEPTSSLDPTSESLVRAALARLTRERTVLVIAHRLNTIYTADRIAVLDAGRVVESGLHADLLASDGAYARLVRAGGRVLV